jgi:hypothetical protein
MKDDDIKESVSLASLLTPNKTVTFDYPGFPGFRVDLSFQSRAELIKLRKSAVTNKFNRSTRQPEEVLNEELFLSEYVKAVIKGWKGLKLSYLEELLLVDLTGLASGITELPYTQDNAETLMKGSVDFDTWVTETIGDLANFTKSKSTK